MGKPKILIVEDEKTIAEYLTTFLYRNGYQIPAVAATGEEAVEAAVRLRPDLVLMDIRIEGHLDGIAAAEQIMRLIDAPVVFVSGYADRGTIDRAMEIRPSGYVVKPFRNASLIAAITEALGQQTKPGGQE